jgi:hypothetical protein
MGVTAGIFLASILLKEMRYLVYIRYLWLNSKKETQLGKFELSPVKKEGLNSNSLKIFDARVKPRHLRHVKPVFH